MLDLNLVKCSGAPCADQSYAEGGHFHNEGQSLQIDIAVNELVVCLKVL